jgi:ADP-heptose:LPS heptosyltransferase
MILEFKLFKLKEDSRLFKLINKITKLNEFIIVGEEKVEDKEYYKIHQLTENGLQLIGGLPLDEVAYSVEKSDLIPTNEGGIGIDYTEIDVPKEYLNMDLIETIQRLNS